MTTNQPTDATRFKAALYAQCPEPVADDIWRRFESLTAELAYHKEYSNFGFQCYQDRFEGALIEQTVRDREVKELNQQIDALTAQLAAAKAKAKAWEARANALESAIIEVLPSKEEARDLCLHIEWDNCQEALAKPKPQPVDASSLARIARVALVAYKFMHAEKSTNCGIDFWSEFVDAYNAIQPNDIALAQALAGGA